VAAAKCGRPVNFKKAQFISPAEMKAVADKAASSGNNDILLTERGSSFGYGNLVVDMRGLVIMRELGYPVVFDATHSVQRPGGLGTASGGEPQFVPYLVRAACAVGIDALFIETHPDPSKALSDAATMIPLGALETLLAQAKVVDEIVKGL
jgi:2-dehydro-3-deoxyphosphooctonate aldolase (KDO 8-P synthase)